MTDAGRKDMTTQAKEKMTPDSQKSNMDKASESVSQTGDKIAGAVQPGDSKSTTQKMGDSVRGNSDEAESQSKSYLQSAQDTASNAASAVSDTLSDLANKISGEGKK